MTKIGIIGSAGRMGQALVAAIEAAGQTHAGGIDQGGDLAVLVAVSDVLVDFSSPHALEATLDACVAGGKPIVIGTTGLEERHHFLIDDAARDIAVLQTGNTSLGITMLASLVRQAASQLGDDWDIEIVEMHHRHKVDAPSGTALLLGEAAAKGRNIDLKAHSERGRDGITGARAVGAIGFASFAGRQRRRRPQCYLCQRQRTHRTNPPRRKPRSLCHRSGEGGLVADRAEGGALWDG